ncbi:hypothetical protein [Bartonella sp. CB10SXKL]|uniref:hypothetical protein n=1 Tax=Bartonella sp. CB10SXKL TaxID=3243509 RepID=UPI0035CF0E92
MRGSVFCGNVERLLAGENAGECFLRERGAAFGGGECGSVFCGNVERLLAGENAGECFLRER